MEFLIGLITGGILCYLGIKRKKPSGAFIIDLSDSAKDVCTLSLYESIDDIYQKRQMTLTIKTIGEDSLK